jgi:hypothetical protein
MQGQTRLREGETRQYVHLRSWIIPPRNCFDDVSIRQRGRDDSGKLRKLSSYRRVAMPYRVRGIAGYAFEAERGYAVPGSRVPSGMY